MRNDITFARYLRLSQLHGMDLNKLVSHRSHVICIVSAILAIVVMITESEADSLSEAEIAHITQMQIYALRTPNDSHPYLARSPDESEYTALVKQMTAVVIDELNRDAILMDFQAAEEIAKLIQTGAQNILENGSSPDAIARAESKIQEFARSILEYGDHVIGSKAAIDPKNGNEVVEIHRSAFYVALRSFCPCWPFCQ
jgi:hypothetical protein